MTRTQNIVEHVAKSFRHAVIDAILEKSAGKPDLASFADDLQKHVMNMDWFDVLDRDPASSVAIQDFVTKIKAERKLSAMGRHGASVGGWECESPEGVGLCCYEDSKACIFCGEPEDRQ